MNEGLQVIITSGGLTAVDFINLEVKINDWKPKLPDFNYANMSHKFQHKLPKWQRRI